MNPTREQAWNLLTEYTHSTTLLKHALAVEAAMRAYAVYFGEDPELWAVTGLVHDLDYEQHPTADEHPLVGVAILEEHGYPQEVIDAVKGHATYLDVPRTSNMAKALFAVDELTGFLIACALVRPDKSLSQLKLNSVRKKWKDKAFARAVDRQEMELGAVELGIDLGEHISRVVDALKPIAQELGVAE